MPPQSYLSMMRAHVIDLLMQFMSYSSLPLYMAGWWILDSPSWFKWLINPTDSLLSTHYCRGRSVNFNHLCFYIFSRLICSSLLSPGKRSKPLEIMWVADGITFCCVFVVWEMMWHQVLSESLIVITKTKQSSKFTDPITHRLVFWEWWNLLFLMVALLVVITCTSLKDFCHSYSDSSCTCYHSWKFIVLKIWFLVDAGFPRKWSADPNSALSVCLNFVMYCSKKLKHQQSK